MFEMDSSLSPALTSEDGTFRIDSCPRVFAVILNWPRFKEVILGGVEAKDLADYFGLQDLSMIKGTSH